MDAVVLSNKKPQIENEATVSELGDGRWVFTERLRWVGEEPREDLESGALFRNLLAKAFPAGTDEATLDRVTRRAMNGMWRVLFGPNDPMLSLLFLHPALAERRFRQRTASAIDAALALEGVGAEQRKAVLVEIAKEADVRKVLNPQQEAEKQVAKGDTGSGGGLVPLLFSVKVPGEVLETNGEVDPVSGEVYWALYPESPVLEELEMRVVYRP
jgi:hypothetical protein